MSEQHPRHRADLPKGNCSCPSCIEALIKQYAPHLLLKAGVR